MAQTQQGRYTEALVKALAEEGICHPEGEPNPRFFSGKIKDGRYARRFCHVCPAIIACAIYSESMGEKEGTWAGITYTANGATHV